MSRPLRSHRSTEAPMDFEYTSRPSSGSKPVWASSGSSQEQEDPSTPKKRPRADLNPPTPLHNPTFGQNQNIPFIFRTPERPPAQPYHWAPPPNFSPSKAFPSHAAPELRDVDMREPSPPKPEEAVVAASGSRKIATGGMQRIHKSRMKQGHMSTISERDRDIHDGSDSEDDADGLMTPTTQNTSNHYTLNMPSPPAPQSDLPYILSGYLQFFFNLSLILLFLYLAIQFILTVQRDVEARISEYSMDIVQDIAMCRQHYENNRCENPLPAMAQQCANWATCMSRDPTIVGRAKVGAEMIAEVVNGFVEPISWKTLAFTLTSLSFLTLFINTLLSLYRSRHQPQVAPLASAAQQFPMAPAAYHPAHAHHFGGYLSPAPTPRRWASREEPETPSRRRRLDGGGAVKIK
ncbi:Di-sulfide bridge nucleocytoplasmic transport domain-containing protein [Mycena rebaudengoi]|nr:Di-sulfide bridge nucleocytoplasmic transport domain-containing protein [Mycena rebaudengoi]